MIPALVIVTSLKAAGPVAENCRPIIEALKIRAKVLREWEYQRKESERRAGGLVFWFDQERHIDTVGNPRK